MYLLLIVRISSGKEMIDDTLPIVVSTTKQ